MADGDGATLDSELGNRSGTQGLTIEAYHNKNSFQAFRMPHKIVVQSRPRRCRVVTGLRAVTALPHDYTDRVRLFTSVGLRLRSPPGLELLKLEA